MAALAELVLPHQITAITTRLLPCFLPQPQRLTSNRKKLGRKAYKSSASKMGGEDLLRKNSEAPAVRCTTPLALFWLD
jgi:hypothetical protein